MATVAQRFASLLSARTYCLKTIGASMADVHTDSITRLERDVLPSGSGFDVGAFLAIEESTPDRLVFRTSFHHMDESGGYDGWSEHSVIVKASLVYGLDIRVTGRDRNQIKDYIGETFHHVLMSEAPAE